MARAINRQDGAVTNHPAPLLAELKGVAQQVAVAAGELVRTMRQGHIEVAATKTTATDVVTEADTAAEKLILEMLRKLRPGDGVLAEEGGAAHSDTGFTWVVDPIDGTVNYLYGLPNYAVSIAVVHGEPDPQTWQVVAGCVHRPEDSVSYTAALGDGAYRQGTAIKVAAPTALSQALVGTGFAYSAKTRAGQAEVLTRVLPQVRDIRRMGSAALDLCAVAAGQLDAYFEHGLSPWDLAAGQLIVTEAGGVVTGLSTRQPSTAMTVAGPPQTVAELSELLAQARADEVGN